MRKNTLTAVALSAVLLFGGCGKVEDNSADTEKTLAAELSDRLDNGDYDISFNISGAAAEDGLSLRIRRFGSDSFMSMDNKGVYTEFVNVDNKTYMIFPEVRCYRITDNSGGFGSTFVKMEKDDKLTDLSEENGRTTEVYTSSDSGGNSTFTFVFDTAKGAEGIEKITEDNGGELTETDVTSVSFSSEPITLPDFSDYDNITDGELVTDVAQVKFYIYYTFGLNEEEAAAQGLDYNEIAHMKLDEQKRFYKELEEKLKGSESSE